MSLAIVRPAEMKDAEGIAYVHVTAWQRTYQSLMPDSILKNLSVERRTRQWKETLQDDTNPYYLTVVAEIDRHIVGFANYGREREDDPAYESELFAIYLLEKFQGSGVYLREKSIQIGDVLLMEMAYGWKDIHLLAEMKGPS